MLSVLLHQKQMVAIVAKPQWLLPPNLTTTLTETKPAECAGKNDSGKLKNSRVKIDKLLWVNLVTADGLPATVIGHNKQDSDVMTAKT
ncbi:hypothetical protein D0Y65_015277 [Glycine soja]|uniref:Uncharacterized protein n=1 Tax=Glycine soja TaxID=3848 RepID=A0A445KCH3_GLYSO|nr:hypothetical protein D0Y65_015277 [Glycine soja]